MGRRFGADQSRELSIGIEHYSNAGFDHHVVKPADIGALQRLLSSAQPDRPGIL